MRAEQKQVFRDEVRRATPLVTVGQFRCDVGHPQFEDSGRIRQDCFVFPHLAVFIEHEHAAPIVANPSVVTFYNEGQAYRRSALSPDGDRCDWFGLSRELSREVVAVIDPALADRSVGPFDWARLSTLPRVCLEERLLMRHIASGARVDDATVEECVIGWLEALVNQDRRLAHGAGALTARTRRAVRDVEAALSVGWNEDWSLADLARGAGVSAFHLCRAFRRLTGRTIHQYRESIRQTSALDAVIGTSASITAIGLDAGYSSHSHFTLAFRQTFGATPSDVRRTALS